MRWNLTKIRQILKGDKMQNQIVFLFLMLGLFEAIFALQFIGKKIPFNAWYGFRTKKTTINEETWFEANKFFGNYLLIAGLILIIGNLAILIFGGGVSPNAILRVDLGGFFLAGHGYMIFKIYQYHKNL